MKFQHKYLDAKIGDIFDFEYSKIVRSKEIGCCAKCGSITTWRDLTLNKPVCCEECGGKLWEEYRNDPAFTSDFEKFQNYKKQVQKELLIAERAKHCWKDILIVVRDQLEYFKICIDSIRATSHFYNLYIWDNASQPDTLSYLNSLMAEYQTLKNPDWTLQIVRVEQNAGFIAPNNELAHMGDGDYIICINSDTKVFPFWDTAMTGFLQENEDVAEIGYWGGHMDAEGRGFGGDNGYEIDYIPGWCFCLSRETYNQFGLFNKQLKFAYCEDADLSLRLKEAGKKIYALHCSLVHHYQNKTIEKVYEEREIDVEATFAHNHRYLQHRWKDYIDKERVLLQRKSI